MKQLALAFDENICQIIEKMESLKFITFISFIKSLIKFAPRNGTARDTYIVRDDICVTLRDHKARF